MNGLKKLERTGKILHESELTILVTWLSSIQVYFGLAGSSLLWAMRQILEEVLHQG